MKLKYVINGFLFLAAFFCSTLVKSQSFEGIIEYEARYILKNKNLDISELERQLGKKVTTYYKNGKYKSLSDCEFVSYQLYNNKKPVVYYMNGYENDTLIYSSSLSNKDTPFEYELEEKADTILGKECNKLIVPGKYGNTIYYYSPEIYLNPNCYKNFTHLNMYKRMQVMKSTYLRVIIDYGAFKLDLIAKKITRKKLKRKEFKPPKNKILMEQKEYLKTLSKNIH